MLSLYHAISFSLSLLISFSPSLPMLSLYHAISFSRSLLISFSPSPDHSLFLPLFLQNFSLSPCRAALASPPLLSFSVSHFLSSYTLFLSLSFSLSSLLTFLPRSLSLPIELSLSRIFLSLSLSLSSWFFFLLSPLTYARIRESFFFLFSACVYAQGGGGKPLLPSFHFLFFLFLLILLSSSSFFSIFSSSNSSFSSAHLLLLYFLPFFLFFFLLLLLLLSLNGEQLRHKERPRLAASPLLMRHLLSSSRIHPVSPFRHLSFPLLLPFLFLLPPFLSSFFLSLVWLKNSITHNLSPFSPSPTPAPTLTASRHHKRKGRKGGREVKRREGHLTWFFVCQQSLTSLGQVDRHNLRREKIKSISRLF